MKLKINRFFKASSAIPHDPSKSFFQSLEDAGGQSMRVSGKIGSGTKIHNFLIDYIDTPDGLGICSVMSLCGSAKWNSQIMPIFDTDFKVNCERCNR